MTNIKIPVAELIDGDLIVSPSTNEIMYSVVSITPEEAGVDFAVEVEYDSGLRRIKYWKDSTVEVLVDRG